MGFCPPQTFRREQAPALRCAVYLIARRDAFGTVLPGEASIAFPFVGRGEVLRPSPPGAPQGRMRWRRPLAQCRTTASSQVGANCVRPQTSPSARCCRKASGMMRGFPRRADDICPYGAGVVLSPVGEAISLPQTLPSARCCR